MDHVEVRVGQITKPHGIKGEVAVTLMTDEPERRFARGAKLSTAEGRVLQVAGVKTVSGRWIVRFAGVEDRNGAEALRSVELFATVDADETPNRDNEFFDRQLIGLEVYDAAQTKAGVITSVLHNPAQDLLEVQVDACYRTGGEHRRYIPFVEALVPNVDLAAGRIDLADIAGLLTDDEEDVSKA